MKEPINDWEELQTQWQSYQPDMKKIKQKISWVTWRMGAFLLLDVIVMIGYVFFIFYELSQGTNNWSVNLWNYFVGIIAMYGVYLDFKLRLPIFRAQGDSTQDVLKLYLQRTQVGITLGRLGKRFMWLLLISFWIWVMVNYLYFPEEPKLYAWKLILFGTVWIGLFIPASYWYQRKKQKEYDELKLLWQDYLN